MGLGDYLWPFHKKFSEIPCAREAAISGMVGGIALGSASIIIRNKYKYAYQTAVYGGFVVFWIAFTSCRYQHHRAKMMSEKFLESLSKGDID